MSGQATLATWHDQRSLKTSAFWEAELICARAAAGVAAIFTSASYFSSDFVRRREYKQLVRAHGRMDLEIAWLPITASDVHELGDIQAISTTPVAEISAAKRQGMFLKTAREIVKLREALRSVTRPTPELWLGLSSGAS